MRAIVDRRGGASPVGLASAMTEGFASGVALAGADVPPQSHGAGTPAIARYVNSPHTFTSAEPDCPRVSRCAQYFGTRGAPYQSPQSGREFSATEQDRPRVSRCAQYFGRCRAPDESRRSWREFTAAEQDTQVFFRRPRSRRDEAEAAMILVKFLGRGPGYGPSLRKYWAGANSGRALEPRY